MKKFLIFCMTALSSLSFAGTPVQSDLSNGTTGEQQNWCEKMAGKKYKCGDYKIEIDENYVVTLFDGRKVQLACQNGSMLLGKDEVRPYSEDHPDWGMEQSTYDVTRGNDFGNSRFDIQFRRGTRKYAPGERVHNSPMPGVFYICDIEN